MSQQGNKKRKKTKQNQKKPLESIIFLKLLLYGFGQLVRVHPHITISATKQLYVLMDHWLLLHAQNFNFNFNLKAPTACLSCRKEQDSQNHPWAEHVLSEMLCVNSKVRRERCACRKSHSRAHRGSCALDCSCSSVLRSRRGWGGLLLFVSVAESSFFSSYSAFSFSALVLNFSPWPVNQKIYRLFWVLIWSLLSSVKSAKYNKARFRSSTLLT